METNKLISVSPRHPKGIETGVDMKKLLKAADFICSELGKETSSKVGRALACQDELKMASTYTRNIPRSESV